MPALDHLAGLFYADLAELGKFEEMLVENTPKPYRKLLAHHEHMTVAVEQHYGSPVDVEVLATKRDGEFYSRKIVLHLPPDGAVVLFGIPRINFTLLDAEICREIADQRAPLGRVLIEHNVLREVQLASLYRVEPGPDLCRLFRLSEPRTTYGRTAFIYLDGYLAIELLEIVAPVVGDAASVR